MVIGIKNARKATTEPNEQGAVGSPQIQSTWCALSKHVQLMTQNQKFSVKPPSRLKQSHTMRTKRKAIAIIKGDHVLIREQPPLRRMEFSEATGAYSVNAAPQFALRFRDRTSLAFAGASQSSPVMTFCPATQANKKYLYFPQIPPHKMYATHLHRLQHFAYWQAKLLAWVTLFRSAAAR
jgi:hypothetical protein